MAHWSKDSLACGQCVFNPYQLQTIVFFCNDTSDDNITFDKNVLRASLNKLIIIRIRIRIIIMIRRSRRRIKNSNDNSNNDDDDI